jgi:UDP-N-acetyl-2-amino-2-deoxyglucuronate dehydrogenase
MKNFALTGVAGYIAPRHLKAIHETGNRLVAAADPHDSVGLLDRHFPEAGYFREIERFDRHLEKRRRGPEEDRVHYLSICSPNFLHDAHIRLALRVGAHAICEKPIVINPWNLDALAELEQESGRRVFTVLQLRVHPALLALKERLDAERGARPHDVCMTYVTPRGAWYRYSWKGNPEQSGGVATNIGVHLFDLLLWLFGPAKGHEVHLSEPGRMAGYLELAHARVRWFLSIEGADLGCAGGAANGQSLRSIQVDGTEVEFTGGFTDLHTRVYERTLAGEGFGIDAARPSIELVHHLRTAPVRRPDGATAHPGLAGKLPRE